MYVESTARSGFIHRQAAYYGALELIKSFCNFKTVVKLNDIVENNSFPKFTPVEANNPKSKQVISAVVAQ